MLQQKLINQSKLKDILSNLRFGNVIAGLWPLFLMGSILSAGNLHQQSKAKTKKNEYRGHPCALALKSEGRPGQEGGSKERGGFA